MQDEIDYNVEASEKETGKDIQLGIRYFIYIPFFFMYSMYFAGLFFKGAITINT